ncbi:UDP-N-acetylgalactosamine-undecaprenyl-phosphate N-acetylgalactosaminephosphotransferase [bacterium HR14]|jgi:lipopolysaccharide/colanic/teichoic acid biosynthesis glycosyltransferase|nr:UDP-N-acetylgalactosamine-undecaprenyl-phosphate N-acetylgalactosaminephosphotransferase [bacterium HR14]
MYESLKRIADFLIAGLGLLLTAPLMGVIAALIKMDSPGSVFFAHERVGRYGRKFKVLKFRTMVQDAPKLGGAITAGHDPRITRVGRFLRATKLDEIPQLWNVLKGEMSLVGPRPEVENYVTLYPEEARRLILSVPPGITGLTQIRYRHEERLLAQQSDPEKYYREVLLPQKIASDLEYVRTRGLITDLRLLVQTAFAVLSR